MYAISLQIFTSEEAVKSFEQFLNMRGDETEKACWKELNASGRVTVIPDAPIPAYVAASCTAQTPATTAPTIAAGIALGCITFVDQAGACKSTICFS